MKNERHSHAAKALARARELYQVYKSNLKIAKYNIQCLSFDPYDRCSSIYRHAIKDCRYMINRLSKEIQELKQEIYEAQTEYNKSLR